MKEKYVIVKTDFDSIFFGNNKNMIYEINKIIGHNNSSRCKATLYNFNGLDSNEVETWDYIFDNGKLVIILNPLTISEEKINEIILRYG